MGKEGEKLFYALIQIYSFNLASYEVVEMETYLTTYYNIFI